MRIRKIKARGNEDRVVHAGLRLGSCVTFLPIPRPTRLRHRYSSQTSIFSWSPHEAETMNGLTSMLATPPGMTGRPSPRRNRWLPPCPPAIRRASRWGPR
jgi:hypothetical protein